MAKLATKDELRLRTEALRDDLRLTTEALQHEIETGFQDAKHHADRLNAITREQIRLLAEQMATKGDLQGLRREMRVIGSHVRVIARQVAMSSSRKRKKQ